MKNIRFTLFLCFLMQHSSCQLFKRSNTLKTVASHQSEQHASTRVQQIDYAQRFQITQDSNHQYLWLWSPSPLHIHPDSGLRSPGPFVLQIKSTHTQHQQNLVHQNALKSTHEVTNNQKAEQQQTSEQTTRPAPKSRSSGLWWIGIGIVIGIWIGGKMVGKTNPKQGIKKQ